MSNPKYNHEGYPDPTTYHGTRKLIQEENAIEKRANELIRVLKFVIKHADFELIDRIKLKDKKTGRKFK